MTSEKFRPSSPSKLLTMKDRMHGYNNSYRHRPTRVSWAKLNLPPNKQCLARIFSRLHYIGSHSPEPVICKWRLTESKFYLKHFGYPGNSSMRFVNKWTCHSWL